MEWTAILLLSGLCIVIAFAINKKNARYLLSGYNTMEEEERRNFDLVGYLKIFRRFFIVLGAGSLLVGSLLHVAGHPEYAFIACTLIPLLAIPYLIIKGRQFNQNERTYRWLPGYLAIGFLLIVSVGVLWLFSAGLRENELVITNDHIEIKGMYGETILLHDVRNVALVNGLPALSSRTNGFALGNYLKGYFRAQNGETVKLYVDARLAPFLELRTVAQTYYWNARGKRTIEVFEALKPLVESSRR